MRKLLLTCFISGITLSSLSAQVLFTYGNNNVNKADFLRVYEKNSINKKADFSEPALREYLDLYSLFRMKVKEAELQHLDTLANIQRELNTYRKQLSKNYLTDEQVNNKLVHEAYDRMKEDIHVQHILIMCPPGTDTTAAFTKIDSLYKAITLKKADFSEVAKAYTEDRGSKDNGGDLGYITALQTVYPFENMVYSTPVGKVSKPFKTQFGYHIVKILGKRPARGEVKVAQIMIATPKHEGEEGIANARKRMDTVINELKKGVPFEKLVQEYSDDKFTKDNGGVLPAFPVGRMVPAFESAAFGLKNPGDISAPIQTDYGFHVIKLIEKTPLKPFDSLQATLKRKVDNDSRAQMARDIFFEKIKEKNGFKENTANFNAVVAKFNSMPDTGKYKGTFFASDYANMNQPIFVLGGKNYLQSDFAAYVETTTRGRLMGPKQTVLSDLYKMYVATVVNDFEEHRLVEEHPDFKNLMEEYRDGIMLFELMDRNVWGKASRDTTGLKAFYESHKSKYMWEPGFTGSVYKFKNEAALKEGQKLLAKKDVKDEDVLKALNTANTPDAVSIQRGHYEYSRFKEAPQSMLTTGAVTPGTRNEDGTYTVVKVDVAYSTPTAKTLDEARGYVIAEYQDYLEKQWNEQMRQKYPVKVDEKVFMGMVKK